MIEFDALTLTAFAAVLLLGGLAKGMLGVGLPMITVPLLSTFILVPDAVALMYVPVLVTNVWQAFQGGYFRTALGRFWPMLIFIVGGTWLGARMLVTIDPVVLAAILGIIVIAFSLISLIQPHFRVPERHELWLSLAIGLIAGFFGGLSLFIGPAIIMFLVALHLKKEEFIGAVGLVYTVTLIPIGALYVGYGVLREEHAPLALLATLPVFLGMLLGQWVRGRIDQERFRKTLLVMLIAIGLNLIRKAVI